MEYFETLRDITPNSERISSAVSEIKQDFRYKEVKRSARSSKMSPEALDQLLTFSVKLPSRWANEVKIPLGQQLDYLKKAKKLLDRFRKHITETPKRIILGDLTKELEKISYVESSIDFRIQEIQCFDPTFIPTRVRAKNANLTYFIRSVSAFCLRHFNKKHTAVVSALTHLFFKNGQSVDYVSHETKNLDEKAWWNK